MIHKPGCSAWTRSCQQYHCIKYELEKAFLSIILLDPRKSYTELDVFKDEVFPAVYGWSTSERGYAAHYTHRITTRRRMEALHGEKLLQTWSDVIWEMAYYDLRRSSHCR